MNRLICFLAALIITSIFISCDSDDPVNPAGVNNNQGNLTITFSITRQISWLPENLSEFGDGKICFVYADILRNDVPVEDAQVVVNGKTIPFESQYFKRYTADLDYSDIKPNQKIKCSITIDGKTAEEEVVFPGDITSSPDGSSVSWKCEGNGDFIYVQEIESEEDGTTSETTSYESYPGISDLSSPASVPATAYPKTSTAYLQTTVVQKKLNNAFSSLSPKWAIFTVSDMLSVKINK